MTRKMLLVSVLMVCGWWLPASAGEGYAGASYVSGSTEFDTTLESFDADSDSWKIFGGFNMNKYVGLELTYYDLGNFSDTSGDSTFEADISIFDVSFRGILPLGERYEVFGKLGYSSVDVETATSTDLVTATAEGSDWELFYALGVGLKLGQRFGIRAEWETWDVSDSLEAWSLGAYYRFGAR